MTTSTYDDIELFGLVGLDDELPMPDDDDLRGRIIGETFEHLIGPLQSTALEAEIEPFAHGLATVLFRRRAQRQKEFDRQKDKLVGLLRAADGSEVMQTEIEQTQARLAALARLCDGLALLAENAANCYEIQTGRAYHAPPGNSRTRLAHITGAVFEAKEWIEAHERQEAQKFQVDGRPLVVAGERDWTDVDRAWDILDRSRQRLRDVYATETILYHKADKLGIDKIAADWARRRNVPQVVFRPNWAADGRRAIFRAIDHMLDTPHRPAGVVIFGTNGVALNLADKAEAKGIKVMRVARPAEQAGK